MIIGVSILFLVWDVIDLGFMIRDIVENKGLEVVWFLREKVDEFEKVCWNNEKFWVMNWL